MPPENKDTLSGFLYALGAYVLWGFLPFYMKAVAHISAIEVVAHRVVWAIPIAGFVLWWSGRTRDLKAALTSPRTMGMAVVTAGLVSINWGVYVWAISVERTVEAALGYYINPLFSVFLGWLLIGERLDRFRTAAIVSAVIGVVIITVEAGGLPWVSLVLPFSWGFYAFFRKTLPVGPNQGFMLEVLILLPFALGFISWFGWSGTGLFLGSNLADTVLLLLAGAVTAVPLMLYANGAKGLTLSTIAIMQYITPSMIFLIAVFVFREPFSGGRLIAFGFIWLALVLYSWPVIVASRKGATISR